MHVKRYLVTGAQGFTGRFTTAELLAADPHAIVVGMGRSAHEAKTFTHAVSWGDRRIAAPLPPELESLDRDRDRYRYVSCDLTDTPALKKLVADAAPDVVIHLAAALRDDAAERLVHANVSGTIALFEALATLDAKPLAIYASSGSVYGRYDSLPVREDECCAPVEPYAMSKLAGEYAARVLSGGNGIPTIAARIFNIAGPGQDERHVFGRFASQIAAIAAGVRAPLLEVGDLRPTRDFVDVRDVAAALRTLAESGSPGATYNVASGRETTIDEVLRSTIALAGLVGRVEIVERYVRAGDVSRQYADIAKLTALGYAPRFAIGSTARDVFDYYARTVASAADTGAVMSEISSGATGLPSSQG